MKFFTLLLSLAYIQSMKCHVTKQNNKNCQDFQIIINLGARILFWEQLKGSKTSGIL